MQEFFIAAQINFLSNPATLKSATRVTMDLQLYNSLDNKKSLFIPLNPKRITMYVCGPTVYNHVHIGNGRPAVVFDVLFRLLKHLYPEVIYARNITDLDDRINAKSQAMGQPITEITSSYIASYQDDSKALGCLPPSVEPRATQHIPEMIALVAELISRKHAYVANNNVLFDVLSDPDYGVLSKICLSDMIAGSRVEVATYKKHPGDFVLWKPSSKNLPGWDSPWGIGRPGWHLECSAMVRAHLSDSIDIHGGGHDLQFPHHENELAQARCSRPEHCFVRYWLHNGMLTVANEKMAKSKNNFHTIQELRQNWNGCVLRYALLGGHYRSNLDWSERTLAQAKSSLDRIYQVLSQLNTIEQTEHAEPISAPTDIPQDVLTALCDDLNTPLALALIHNRCSHFFKEKSTQNKRFLGAEIRAAGSILGLPMYSEAEILHTATEKVQKDSCFSPAQIGALIAQRDRARKAKDFALADQIRQQLTAADIALEDGREGSKWRYQ